MSSPKTKQIPVAPYREPAGYDKALELMCDGADGRPDRTPDYPPHENKGVPTNRTSNTKADCPSRCPVYWVAWRRQYIPEAKPWSPTPPVPPVPPSTYPYLKFTGPTSGSVTSITVAYSDEGDDVTELELWRNYANDTKTPVQYLVVAEYEGQEEVLDVVRRDELEDRTKEGVLMYAWRATSYSIFYTTSLTPSTTDLWWYDSKSGEWFDAHEKQHLDHRQEPFFVYAWADPDRILYTTVNVPVVQSTPLWGADNGIFVQLPNTGSPRVYISDTTSDLFDTLHLHTGANIEISNDGKAWTTWSQSVEEFDASVTVEGETLTISCVRNAAHDIVIGGVQYYSWRTKGDNHIWTITNAPAAGAKVYYIDLKEQTVSEIGAVTEITDTGYNTPVVNGIIYVRAKSGSTPIYGFGGLFSKVEGKVMSLVDYENVDTCVLAPYQFANIIYYGSGNEGGLFYDYTEAYMYDSSAPFLYDASNLVMPSAEQVTPLSAYALSMMFNNCLSLSSDYLPTLTTPAIAQGIYDCFHFGCTSLNYIPAGYLDHTFTSTPGVANYSFMFSQCTALKTIPSGLLNTQYLGGCFWSDNSWGYQSAYTEMFSNCYSLRSVPADLLPATTLTPCCYGHMFMGCNSLEYAPNLNAETLAPGCYKGMFNSCNSLQNAPSLPATTLVGSDVPCVKELEICYGTGSTTPWISTRNLSLDRFNGDVIMYAWDSEIDTFYTTIENPIISTPLWSYNSETGVWTEETSATACIFHVYTTCEPKASSFNANSRSFSRPSDTELDIWKEESIPMFAWKASEDDTVVYTDTLDPTSSTQLWFYVEPTWSQYGHAIESVVQAVNVGIRGVYQEMYYGCGMLENAPVLPASTLTSHCYWNMFRGCNNLRALDCQATVISGEGIVDPIENWLMDVGSPGMFTRNASTWAGFPNASTSGVPPFWTITPAAPVNLLVSWVQGGEIPSEFSFQRDTNLDITKDTTPMFGWTANSPYISDIFTDTENPTTSTVLWTHAYDESTGTYTWTQSTGSVKVGVWTADVNVLIFNYTDDAQVGEVSMVVTDPDGTTHSYSNGQAAWMAALAKVGGTARITIASQGLPLRWTDGCTDNPRTEEVHYDGISLTRSDSI